MIWTTEDVHELLLRWGVLSARMQDGGLGHASQVAWIQERAGTPYRAIEPAEFTAPEVLAVDAAIRQLGPRHQVVVLCYYKPGHLKSRVLDEGRDLGRDGKGRQRSPALRAIAGYLGISHESVAVRLSEAKNLIAQELTVHEESDRIRITV